MRTVPVEIGGKTRKLRYGSMAAQNAVDEIQRAAGFQLIPGSRLQIADAANLATERGDVGVIQTFLRHGLLNETTGQPDKGLTPERIYGWIDQHILPVDQGGPGGDLTAFSGPIVRALTAAGLVKAAPKADDGLEEERPTPLSSVRTLTPPAGE